MLGLLIIWQEFIKETLLYLPVRDTKLVTLSLVIILLYGDIARLI